VIRFVCPACNKGLKPPDDGVGRKSHCPRCGQRVLIPGPAAASGPPQAQTAWAKFKQWFQAIPKAVREAVAGGGKALLEGVVPGAAPAIELTKAVLEWALEKDSPERPKAGEKDVERVVEVVTTLTGKLDDLVAALARMPKDRREQGEGLVRGRVIHDSDMPEVIRELEDEVRTFDVLKAHYRAMLKRQGYGSQLLEDMLGLTLRFVGLSELLPEIEAAKRSARLTDGEFEEKATAAVKSFQDGARSFGRGNFAKAAESFGRVTAVAPKSVIARGAWETAKVVSGPPNAGTAQQVRDILKRLPSPSPVGGGVIRVHFPIRDEEVPGTFPSGRKVRDVILWNACNLSDKGMRALCATLPGVTRLSVRNARRLTDGVVPDLCKLSQLQRLLIWGSRLTQSGVSQLQSNRHWDVLNLR
jgi:DNA-directed RNA polymerase subunit RPC12/RpoP